MENEVMTEKKSDNNGSSTKNFLLGALIGGVVGAATAIYLSPKSGKELRQTFNEQANLIKNKGEQFRQIAINTSNELVETAKDFANLNKEIDFRAKEEQNEEVKYVAIKPHHPSNDEVQRKLEEAKRALENEELKIKA